MQSTNDDPWESIEGLVERSQAGDREAFGELVQRFEASIQALARRRLGDVHEAAEVAQEVFFHAYRKLAQLREPACFGAWLKQIATRLLINRAVRRRPLPQAPALLLELAPARRSGPLDDLVERESRASVRSAVAQLRPIDRDVLVAFYFEDRPLSDIAEDFSIPVGTVKRRLHVARRRLQESLEPSEGMAGVQRRRVDVGEQPPAYTPADCSLTV